MAGSIPASPTMDPALAILLNELKADFNGHMARLAFGPCPICGEDVRLAVFEKHCEESGDAEHLAGSVMLT